MGISCKEVNIASESAGKIVQVNFKMGDFVTKGKVLAKIDDTYKSRNPAEVAGLAESA